MAAASTRLEFRVNAEKKARIARAATILDVPVGEFARTAAEEKAEEIIRDHEATTVVPAEFFDDLLRVFDMPPAPAPDLIEAVKHARRLVTKD